MSHIFPSQSRYALSTVYDKCLERYYNKGTDKEAVNYHYDVLEAKILLDGNLVASIAGGIYREQWRRCRRAEKLKKAFPRLLVAILADSLYAPGLIMDICRRYDWNFIIWYKTGSISGIAEEYGNIPGKGKSGHAGNTGR